MKTSIMGSITEYQEIVVFSLNVTWLIQIHPYVMMQDHGQDYV